MKILVCFDIKVLACSWMVLVFYLFSQRMLDPNTFQDDRQMLEELDADDKNFDTLFNK